MIVEHKLEDDGKDVDFGPEFHSNEQADEFEDEAEIDEKNYEPWWLFGGSLPKSGRDLGTHVKSLEDRASFLSLWTISFMDKAMQLGSTKVIDREDIGVPSEQDRSDRVYRKVLPAYKKEVERCEKINLKLRMKYEQALDECHTEEERDAVKEPSYVTPSVFRIGFSFGLMRATIALTFCIISAFLQFGPALILSDLVAYVEHYAEFGSEVPYEFVANLYVEVFLLFFLPPLSTAFLVHGQLTLAHLGNYVGAGLSTLIYQKALKLSPAARGNTSTGQVVNLMSTDTLTVAMFFTMASNYVSSPIIVTLALYLIYQQVGSAMWVGVGYMVVLAPITVVVFGIVGLLRKKVVQFGDTRIKLMNELLAGIRIVKFYAWEKPFGKEVSRVRSQEMKALTTLSYVATIGFSVILLSAPIVQPVLVFITYVNISDEPLSAAKTFTTVALFNIMRFPFTFLPVGLLAWIQAKISTTRLSRAFGLAELARYVDSKPDPSLPADSPYCQSGSISLTRGNFSWADPDAKDEATQREEGSSMDSGDNAQNADAFVSNAGDIELLRSPTIAASGPTLQNISCRIEAGSLVAVVGSVGSGKSSFLTALLGEMESVNGSKVFIPRTREEMNLNGYISYCSQSPWIIGETIRGNIVFGRLFDRRRYERVLDYCALRDDLAILPAGDMTEIGERGINLSGGQKARIALARSFYSRDTKVLLMDDPLSAVDAHVGEHLFEQAIAGPLGKGVTRVLVTHQTHVLPRCDKVIVMEGGHIKHQGTFKELVENGVDFTNAQDAGKQETGKADVEISGEDENGKQGVSNKVDPADDEELKKAGEKLIEAEYREEGQVSWATYARYFRAGGMRMFWAVVIIQFLGRGLEVGANFWLARWSDDMSSSETAGDPLTDSELSYYIGIYGLLSSLGVVMLGVRGIFLARHRLGASELLHNGVLKSILRAPIAFFDVSPLGRILSRFAYDTRILDLEVSSAASVALTTLASFLGSVVGIILATKGLFLIVVAPVTYLYYLLQLWFRQTSTEVKREMHLSKSPLFEQFSQMLVGTPTIRAYGAQGEFFEKYRASLDHEIACKFWAYFADFWLQLRLDIIGGLVSLLIAIAVLITLPYDFIPAGYFGLALSFAIEMTLILKFGVQIIAILEQNMSSIERLLEYTDTVKPDAPDVIEGNDPEPNTWPKHGAIQFSNISMRYRNGPLVLKGLNIDISAGEKVGVCGRTGSGKSSLMISLFRLYDIEDDGGRILIDGVNTSDIGTDALRRNLAIIPQDPVLFSTTVRFNIDPFESKTDEELWSILKQVQLEEFVSNMPGGLDGAVSEGGENFSQGQRQLLCIARAVVLEPKILIMDEATASIDNETDAAMQEMIRTTFKSATVLTIAHRLNTIMDSDRILVLDQGELAELDTPRALLSKKDSIFKSMVERSQEAQNI